MSRKLTPVIILAVLLGLAYLVLRNPPQADRSEAPAAAQLVVDVMKLERQPYQVNLQSYGTVQPRTQSILVAQVFGEITSINDSLRTGGFFEKGEKLLSIDQRDYLADVKISDASLMGAKQALAEEKARSMQALEDWNRLGNQGEAPALVLRKPQLAAAEARVISARLRAGQGAPGTGTHPHRRALRGTRQEQAGGPGTGGEQKLAAGGNLRRGFC